MSDTSAPMSQSPPSVQATSPTAAGGATTAAAAPGTFVSPSTPFPLPQLRSQYPSLPAYRTACMTLAQASERSERFDDCARFVRELIRCSAQDGSELSAEEQRLLYVSYTNICRKLRGGQKAVSRAVYTAAQAKHSAEANAAQQAAQGATPLPLEDKYVELLSDYQSYAEQQIASLCSEITQLLENSVVKTSTKVESKVFYSKLCGDYYRYCSEVIPSRSLRVPYEKKCFEHYSYALKLAHAQLPSHHPQRLSISLNYSVCLYELLGDHRQACDLAKSAFDAAIHRLDELDEHSYRDATLIMQLLRDNLTLWNNTVAAQQGQTPQK